jgi:hypothetical protein
MQKLICINNIGASYSYGDISKIISIGEIVTLRYIDGCCYAIKKSNGEKYTLNRKKFKEVL